MVFCSLWREERVVFLLQVLCEGGLSFSLVDDANVQKHSVRRELHEWVIITTMNSFGNENAFIALQCIVWREWGLALHHTENEAKRSAEEATVISSSSNTNEACQSKKRRSSCLPPFSQNHSFEFKFARKAWRRSEVFPQTKRKRKCSMLCSPESICLFGDYVQKSVYNIKELERIGKEQGICRRFLLH